MSATLGETTVFRGSSLEEVLARVRDELGPDAVVVRQREGVVGGIGGFFARKCIEVEAAPGWPTAGEETVRALPAHEAMSHYGAARDGADLDDRLPPPANDFMEALLDRAAAFDELFVPTDPVGLLPASQGAPQAARDETVRGDAAELDFERMIARAVAATEDEPDLPFSAWAAEPERFRGRRAPGDAEAAVRSALSRAGMSGAASERVIERVHRHLRPHAPTTSVRDLARLAVRSAITVPHGWDGRRVIAFAGLDDAPVVRTVAALAGAQAEAGMRVAVIALGGGRHAARLAAYLLDTDVDVLLARDLRDVEPALADAAAAELVLAVAPALAADDCTTGAGCAAPLVALHPDELHLVVPAAVRPARVHRALELLDPFLPVDCLLPLGAGIADERAVAVGVALERRLALRWVASSGSATRIHPADPALLAEALLP